MRYPASVAVTWQHTFQQLTPTAAALLRLTAFLAPDPIPVEIFEQGAEHVEAAAGLFCEESGKAPDGKPIEEAVADLAGFSMISRQDGRTLSVHRMVQEALRQQLPEERRKSWIEGALRIVNDSAAEDVDDVRTWPVWDRLRPHVAEVVARAAEVGIVKPTNRLLSDLGVLLWAKGLYSEAEPLVRRALDIDEADFGFQHTMVAIRLGVLALVLMATNRLGEAEPLMRRALAIDEASFGNEHPNVARDLNNLATLLRDTNRLGEAEPLMRRAVDIWERSLGPDHPNTQIGRKNLTILLAELEQAAGEPDHPTA